MVTFNIYKANSNFEMCFMVFCTVFNASIFGYIINKVGRLLENIN